MGFYTGVETLSSILTSPDVKRQNGIAGVQSLPRHRRRLRFERAYAFALYTQCLVAVLIGMRLLPLPAVGSTDRPRAVEIVVAVGFLLLSCMAAGLLVHRRKEQEAHSEVLHLAFHDAVTGLPNRAAVERTMEEWLKRGNAFSCICMELDGADAHSASDAEGDEPLIQSVVLRLLPFVVDGAILGRLSTDRFLLLLRGVYTKPGLDSRAEEILHALVPPHALEKGVVATSVTMGIATAPDDATDRAGLLTAAKHAMALARSEERNHFRFANDSPGAGDTRNAAISGKLQRALLEGSLQLVYQPIYNNQGEMVAAEALARWHDAEQGHISPAEFVPIAEATGLIVPLSNWVLRQACRQMAEWCSMGSPIQRIAVNVSVKQVSRKDFIHTIEQTLKDAGLEPRYLELEVTEGALANDFQAVNLNLQALRRNGVRISIDDFGTGYSSLGRVRELNADVLKIDRIFVQGATESKGGAAMVQAIIDMAHTLQLSVVAEGIETGEQMAILRGMNCDEMQGYLLARPQPPEALTHTFRQVPTPTRSAEQQPVKMVPRPAGAS